MKTKLGNYSNRVDQTCSYVAHVAYTHTHVTWCTDRTVEQRVQEFKEGEWMLDKREKEEAEIHYLTRGAALTNKRSRKKEQ
uniref:Uncharacterized protein n=1 Tax=Loa loa TaxID=7209 RepID=A0A1I7VSK2_LOALO